MLLRRLPKYSSQVGMAKASSGVGKAMDAIEDRFDLRQVTLCGSPRPGQETAVKKRGVVADFDRPF